MSSNYDDLRQYLETAEKRAHRRTLLATLIPVVAVIALVLVAGSRLVRAKAKLEEANAELSKTNAELKQAGEQRESIIRSLTAQIAKTEQEKQSNLVSLRNQIHGKEARVTLEATIEKGESTPTSLVYLQIAGEDQRNAAGDLQTDLITSGYAVPGIENVSRKHARIPKQTEIRYFRDEDRVTAEGVVKQLAQKGVAATAVREPGKAKKPVEVWFSKNARLKRN